MEILMIYDDALKSLYGAVFAASRTLFSKEHSLNSKRRNK